ncbi:cytochrome P450 [Stachybotrys elegans]|uniref:Cytochrome P450 n=1 Tax=Stachybotrys elegans TaxID=80388 RepID=A0A8K0STA7_9HYPO|nr:cytochrome P450 [Stachybotrys elegans]
MRIHNCQPAPSYPHSDPLLGIDWTMTLMRKAQANETLQWFHGLYTEVGNTHWNNNLGTWNLTTNEPENVKAILATQFESWPIASLRLRFGLLALGPHAIFSTNGHEWQEARAMIRPSFVRNQIADFECIEKHMCNFLARLPSDGSKIDLQDLLYDFTMDTSTDFMFGYSTNTLVKPSPEALEFIESFTYSLFTAANRGRAGWVAFWLPNKKLNDAVWKCKRFIDHYMEEALAEGKPKASYVFMNQMVESGASHEYIRDQLLAMILGGRDTTASTLSALFWTLARRPDVVEKLRAEITKELGDEAPTWETLKNMSYLNMVLKEALRLWPPVASNFRCANKDVVLPKGGGPDGQSPVFVPKGSGCRWVTWSMHRRKDLYEEDAEEFRPERWETLRTSWEYVPFSGGPRICIGQQFAWTMMSYLVARVFQTFRAIEARDDREMAIKLGVTTSLPNGCWVSLASVTTEATPCHVVQT